MEKLNSDIEIKLIALDMDGTLLDDHHEISEANRQAIKEAQEKGIYVVLSTGRSLRKCEKYADSLALTSYLVTVNGSEIWDDKRGLVERNLVNTDSIQWMVELTQKHKIRYWAISTSRNWFDEMPEDIHGEEWLKFGFNIKDVPTRDKILNELQTRGEFELSNSTPTNIEVNPAGINKAKGLKLVCERLGIHMKNVMAVGDSLNDLAMIKEAGLGVAMRNAQDTVKEAAAWVTSTNNEDGVAKAIQKWVL
ncbi:phosphoglycolate phosphatase (TIGR01487 family) [Neobacillus niacini]|uniref:Cof-type HAD-IIB family hydrolase n=1 Tax=Neobacillus niacini TaxID=86668 RepID=UPI0027881F9C|nr:Cof-type HAD-IIB family hydrolase [Neobacillus niacini]MDQ1003196.1 phosphoglycolate phosphatase (TIGR01487 family) [Neobacillus niacini]